MERPSAAEYHSECGSVAAGSRGICDEAKRELRRLYTILNIMPKDMDDTNKNLLAQFSPKEQVRLVWCLQHGARQHVLHTWPAAASGRV